MGKIYLVLLGTFFLNIAQVCVGQGSMPDTDNCGVRIDRMIRLAKSFVGTPYVWAADGPDSFDCSGFVRFVYASVGVDLPRNSRQQSLSGEVRTIRNIRRGDLVFFLSGVPPERDITHVGIAITDYEKGNFRFIHANRSSGCVSISDYCTPFFQKTFAGARKVFPCE